MPHTPGPWFVADWQDDFGDNLVTIEARSYARERGWPVVHIPLGLTLSDGDPDTAEVRFDGRAPVVRRYNRGMSASQ